MAYWPLNANTLDTSGNNIHATAVAGYDIEAASTVPVFTAGKTSGGLPLNGVNQWLRVDPTGAKDSTSKNNAYSVLMWAKSTASAPTEEMILFEAVQGPEYSPIERYRIGTKNGKWSVYANYKYTFAFDVSSTEWVPIAVTFDSAYVRMYVGGILVSEFISGSPPFDMAHIIGARELDGSIVDFWNGTIDEVRLYNRALTADEIKAVLKY